MEKIQNLVKLKERPETTLILARTLDTPEKTISSYIFTPSIKEYFEKILERIYQKGGGYWIQAEYGAGKTHFMGTLVCLLLNENENLLNKIQEEEIKILTKKILSKKYFPVILSLIGKASTEGKDNLLSVIEEGIERKVDELKLRDKILINTEDEIINWYKESDFKDKIDIFIRKNTKSEISNINKSELAKLIDKYCKENKTRPDITTKTKDRIRHIYSQLIKNGFDGVLFVIDDFACWQDRHLQGTPEYALDEEVLETIGWILPVELDLKIYTFIASQKEPPAKLKGDRFIKIELLGGKSEKDYDIIASNRIRDIIKEKEPEIEQYYEYCYKEFKFLKTISKDFFFKIFPFQPKCFEVLRKITERQLPSERSAINVAYETLSNDEILQRDTLINLSDLINSNHLIQDCLNTFVYNSIYKNYQSAINDIQDLELDKDEMELAKSVITTLFLYYCAYFESTKPLSPNDITELTLTTGDYIKGVDRVESILSKLRDVPQIDYKKDKGAIFVSVSEDKIIKASEKFKEIKKKIPKENCVEIQKGWEEGLILSTDLEGENNLFSGYKFDTNIKTIIEHNKIEYPGEVILSKDIRDDYYTRLKDIHFRVVLLTKKTETEIDKIEDERIAICVPSEFTETIIEAIRDYIAIRKMEEEYTDKSGSEEEKVQDWIKDKKKEVIRNLISKQKSIYMDGEIYTKRQLSFDTKKIFWIGKIEKILQDIGNFLLSDAYTEKLINYLQIKKKLTSSDVKKIFDGLFKRLSSSANLSACDNFAIGLNLTTIDNPRKFNPANNTLFSILEKMLIESSGEVSTWKIYDLLQNPPYGLTKEIITLYLLSFVTHRIILENEEKNIEISLKPNNRLQVKSNKITSFDLHNIDWKTGIENDFDILTLSSEVSWNEILSFAKILNSNLKTATRAEDIIEQERMLIESCNSLKNTTKQVEDNLNILIKKLQEEIKDDINNCIENFKDIADVKGRTEFYNKVKEKFETQDEFKKNYEFFSKLKEISNQSLRLISILDYLQQIIDTTEGESKIGASEIYSKIRFKDILQNPNIIQSLENEFEKFKNLYKNKYQIHHRDFNKSQIELKKLLLDIEPKIKAIKYFCEVKELNIVDDVSGYYGQFLDRINPCSEKDPVSVENSPFCSNCKLKLADIINDKEIQRFIDSVNEKLQTYANNLLNILTKEILIHDKKNKLQELISAIQSKNINKFITLLTLDLVDYIKNLISKANILTLTIPVFSKIRQKYSYVDEENIEVVVKEFLEELANAIEEAKRKNPGKKIRISFG